MLDRIKPGLERNADVPPRNAPQLTARDAHPRWIGQRERGQTLLMRSIVWIALSWGRTAARALLYPIALYFFLFSRHARFASRKYLRKVLAREPAAGDLYRHYHTFAATILDRVFFVNGRTDEFEIRTHGEDLVQEALGERHGCLLIGAHLGSFEVIRAMGRRAAGLRVSMVMYEENARKLNSVLQTVDRECALNVIPLGRIDSMLKVQEALARGEWVGMLADRTISGEGTLPCAFFGETAQIPVGPFRMAALLRKPVVLMFGLYRGGKRYDVFFEHLADMRSVDRAHRDESIENAVRTYAGRLEHYCRMAPYNWFNFYDFWD